VSTLLVILLAACATPGGRITQPPGSPDPSNAQTTAPTTTPFPTVIGPVGRVPLVIRQYSCDICDFRFGTTVLADGRVIWEDGLGTSVRRLSANGLAWVRALLDRMPQLAANASYEPTLIPGATPPAFGPTDHTFLLERGDQRIRVRSADAPTFAAFPDVWVVPAEAVVLSTLAEQMKDPESWFPPASWAGPATDFTPDRYLVSVGLWENGQGAEGFVDIDDVAWPFGAIDSVGMPTPFGPGGTGDSGGRCVVISADQARSMAAAEIAAGGKRELDVRVWDWTYRSARENGARIPVETRWLLPYQMTDCRDTWNQ
jgi:hypothetical protein